jgi:hypothetical protein
VLFNTPATAASNTTTTGGSDTGKTASVDAPAGGKLTLLGEKPNFSYLAVTDANGQLSWVDSSITGGLVIDNKDGIQFDEEGSIYYFGKITRDGQYSSAMLAKTTLAGVSSNLFAGPIASYQIVDSKLAVYVDSSSQKLVSLNLETKATSPISTESVSVYQMMDRKVYYVTASAAKVYDLDAQITTTVDLSSLCTIEMGSTCNPIDKLVKYGGKLIAQWNGKLIQIHPSVEAYSDLSKVGAVIDDSRVVLVDDRSSDNVKLVLQDDGASNSKDIALSQKFGRFDIVRYSAANNSLIFMAEDIKPTGTVLMLGTVNLTTGESSAKPATGVVDLQSL